MDFRGYDVQIWQGTPTDAHVQMGPGGGDFSEGRERGDRAITFVGNAIEQIDE